MLARLAGAWINPVNGCCYSDDAETPCSGRIRNFQEILEHTPSTPHSAELIVESRCAVNAALPRGPRGRVVPTYCTVFGVDDNRFCARTREEKELWLRAVSNIKVKLMFDAPEPTDEELSIFRAAVQERVETMGGPPMGGDPLLAATKREPMGCPEGDTRDPDPVDESSGLAGQSDFSLHDGDDMWEGERPITVLTRTLGNVGGPDRLSMPSEARPRPRVAQSILAGDLHKDKFYGARQVPGPADGFEDGFGHNIDV